MCGSIFSSIEYVNDTLFLNVKGLLKNLTTPCVRNPFSVGMCIYIFFYSKTLLYIWHVMSKAVVSYLAATCIIISHYETFSGSHVAYMLGHVSCCNLPYLLHVLTSDDLFAIVVRHLHPMQASPFRAP